MVSKLNEMDSIIEEVDASLISSDSLLGYHTLLMVVSDHGMTDGGNHGGATSQETDALALFIAKRKFQYFSETHNQEAFQVDIVPTLALLLGVPIPKNNVGVVLLDLFSSLNVTEKLRALELNSWQLMRLLHVRSPKSLCVASICSDKITIEGLEGVEDGEDIFRLCSMFRLAAEMHQLWKCQLLGSDKGSSSANLSNWKTVAEAYMLFLRSASSWLARGTTEKKMLFIYVGGLFMLFSLVIIIWVAFLLCKGSFKCFTWQAGSLEEIVAVGGVAVHAITLGSSSLVEEEQVTWYYLVTTICFIFIRHACQSVYLESSPQWKFTFSSSLISELLKTSNQITASEKPKKLKVQLIDGTISYGGIMKAQFLMLIVVVISGRVLRGWHRSGVNWAHLCDIAKWLEDSNSLALITVRLISLLLVTTVGCILVLEMRPRLFLQKLIAVNMAIASFLTMSYILWTHNSTAWLSGSMSILLAQLVYAILGGTSLLALLFSPWLALDYCKMGKDGHGSNDKFVSLTFKAREQACLNFIGRVFLSCWCLLQLLLQQPVNTGPVGLLMLQLLAIISFFNNARPAYSLWMKVLTLFWMGSAGHFGLGNTNTLATVDVAGAYIGLRSHSILLTGILAFIITYASPIMFMLGLLVLASMFHTSEAHAQEKWQNWLFHVVAVFCVVPLTLNAVMLTTFTGIMFLMQGHLFVWSVFAPK
eukprot:c19661_g1_i1 orf=687-2798(+)